MSQALWTVIGMMLGAAITLAINLLARRGAK